MLYDDLLARCIDGATASARAEHPDMRGIAIDVRLRRGETASWTFARADYKRRATKWRCPTGQCKPASVCVKADRLHH